MGLTGAHVRAHTAHIPMRTTPMQHIDQNHELEGNQTNEVGGWEPVAILSHPEAKYPQHRFGTRGAIALEQVRTFTMSSFDLSSLYLSSLLFCWMLSIILTSPTTTIHYIPAGPCRSWCRRP